MRPGTTDQRGAASAASDPFRDLALTESADGVTIPIRAVPRAGRDAIDGVTEGALRVRLAAPPVEGGANRALVAFLAGSLGVPKRDLDIISGAAGGGKSCACAG